MRLLALLATSAVIAAAATAAQAQPLPPGGLTAGEAADWLRGQGLDAAVTGQPDAPRVESGANGVSWDMSGFDCQAGRCASWQFTAAFVVEALPDGAIERWNLERRYLKAFAFRQGEVLAAVAQYDVLITPGLTYEGLTEHMRLFASVAPLFAVEIGAVSAD